MKLNCDHPVKFFIFRIVDYYHIGRQHSSVGRTPAYRAEGHIFKIPHKQAFFAYKKMTWAWVFRASIACKGEDSIQDMLQMR